MRSGELLGAINIKEFARLLAWGDDDEQAEFLNMFCKELVISCRGETGLENQICSITSKLDFTTKEIFDGLSAFLALRIEKDK